jgi:hypothetical protein
MTMWGVSALNDNVGNGLPCRYAPRNDEGVLDNGELRLLSDAGASLMNDNGATFTSNKRYFMIKS